MTNGLGGPLVFFDRLFVHLNNIFVLRDLTPTLRTIIHIPNQPLITNRTPTSKTDCLAARILGIDQQHKQDKNYRQGSASQEFLPQPICFFRNPSVTDPIRHNQDVCRQEDHSDQPQHSNLSNRQTHHISSNKLMFTNIDGSA